LARGGKWADVLERIGIQCYYIAGESDRPGDRTFIIEEAHHNVYRLLGRGRRAVR